MNIKKGDTIKVLYGKDSGKTGEVLAVLPKTDKILVSGVNKVTRHVKGDGKKRKSEIVIVERPLTASKVMVICPNCKKPTRIGTQRKGAGYVRVCKQCGKEFAETVKAEKIEKVTEKTEANPKKKTSKK